MNHKLYWKLLLVSAYLVFTYNPGWGWWNSSTGSLLIVLFGYLAWKKEFVKVLGFKFNSWVVLKTILFALVCIVLSYAIMNYIAQKQNVQIVYTSWRRFYHTIFYVLNEEIILGAIVLFVLVNEKKIKPIVASLSLAVAFSLIHFVFYKWIFVDRGIIQPLTLFTLFFVGFVRNNLILLTGHIGYSWALHVGWIIIMFGCDHVFNDSEVLLNEPGRFNMYLGSLEMFLISFVLALLIMLYWIKFTRKIKLPELI